MLSVTFLGTSAARPTVERNVSALALVREGETLLFECGEGTQRQMMRYGVSFALSEIFFTHFHADHFLGVIGLVRTLGLQTREQPLRLYGPKGAKHLLKAALELGVERVPFEVKIEEVKPGMVLGAEGGGGGGGGGKAASGTERDGYAIQVFATEHGGGSVGYAVREHERPGRFDPGKARAAGVPEGPLWGQLQQGETAGPARRHHRRHAPLRRGGRCSAASRSIDPRGHVWGGREGPRERNGAFDRARGGAGGTRRPGAPAGLESRVGPLFNQRRGAGQGGARRFQGNNGGEGRADDRGAVSGLT